jgi:hypothetical protein
MRRRSVNHPTMTFDFQILSQYSTEYGKTLIVWSRIARPWRRLERSSSRMGVRRAYQKRHYGLKFCVKYRRTGCCRSPLSVLTFLNFSCHHLVGSFNVLIFFLMEEMQLPVTGACLFYLILYICTLQFAFSFFILENISKRYSQWWPKESRTCTKFHSSPFIPFHNPCLTSKTSTHSWVYSYLTFNNYIYWITVKSTVSSLVTECMYDLFKLIRKISMIIWPTVHTHTQYLHII